MTNELLEEHEGLRGDVLNDVVRFLIDEVFLEHVDLVVFEHAPLSHLTQILNLSCKALVLVDLLHEPGILLWLGRVDSLRPASLLVEHSLFSSAHPHCVHLVDRKVGDVVQLNKVRISLNVVLILEVVLGSRVEGSADGTGVCESWRPAELSASTGVLVKLRHEIYITYVTQINLN
jgi:hypothetical protein